MSDNSNGSDPLSPETTDLYHQAVLDVMRWVEKHDQEMDHDVIADCVVEQARVIHDMRGRLSAKMAESAARSTLEKAMSDRFS